MMCVMKEIIFNGKLDIELLESGIICEAQYVDI